MMTKTIVITGAKQGIGLATTKKFLAEGWNVMMADLADASVVADELGQQYEGRVAFTKTDVTKQADLENLLAATLKQFGQVDALYNNAGIFLGGSVTETSVADWDKMMNIDVKSVFLSSKTFLPEMLKQKFGVIINTSSVSGLLGDYGEAAYDAAKGAVTNLTRSMALDYGQYGIRVNAVNPGPTMTPLMTSAMPEEQLKAFIAKSPMKRLVAPEDIANTVFFLASDAARSINGENIPVTNGSEIHTGLPVL